MKFRVSEPTTKKEITFFERNAELIGIFAKVGIAAQVVSAFTEYSIIGEIIQSNIPFLSNLSLTLDNPLWLLIGVAIVLGGVFALTRSIDLVIIFGLMSFGFYTAVNLFSTIDFATFIMTLLFETSIMFLLVLSVKRGKLKKQTGVEKLITGVVWLATLLLICVSIFLSLQGWNNVTNNHLDQKEETKQNKTNKKYEKRRNRAIADYNATMQDHSRVYDDKIALIESEYASKIETLQKEIAYWRQMEIVRGKKFTSKISKLDREVSKAKEAKSKKIEPIQKTKSSKISIAQIKRDNKLEELENELTTTESKITTDFDSLKSGYEIGGGIIIIICLIINIVSTFIRVTTLIESGIIKTPILNSYDVRDALVNEAKAAITERVQQQLFKRIDNYANDTPEPSQEFLPKMLRVLGDQPRKTIRLENVEDEEFVVSASGEMEMACAVETVVEDSVVKPKPYVATELKATTKKQKPVVKKVTTKNEVKAQIDRAISDGYIYKAKILKGEGRWDTACKHIESRLLKVKELKLENPDFKSYRLNNIQHLNEILQTYKGRTKPRK